MLLSLAVSTSVFTLSNQILLKFLTLEFSEYHDIDNFEVQLYQLLIHSELIEVNTTEMKFIYENKEYHISTHNHRIVKTPGYEILLEEVDYLSLEENNNYLKIVILRGNTEHEILYEL